MADDLDRQQQEAERGGEAGGDSAGTSFPEGGATGAGEGGAGSVKGRPGVTSGGSSGTGSTGPFAGADLDEEGVDPSPGPSGDGV